MKDIKNKVEIYCGKNDEVISPINSMILNKNCKTSSLFIFDCGHNDFPHDFTNKKPNFKNLS